MKTLSKAVMASALSNNLKLSKAAAKEMVELFFDSIKEALEAGEAVKLSGFGNFSSRDKTERPGRNPKTGKVAAVSARRVVTFKSGLKLKKSLKQKEL